MTYYWILIFNRERIDRIDKDRLINALKLANHETLCAQYIVDQALIPDALQHLRLVTAQPGNTSIGALHYELGERRPLIIYLWDVSRAAGSDLLTNLIKSNLSGDLMMQIRETQQIIGIQIMSQQLKDMGLVFGYEIARWMADQGQGLVRGLDGGWYCLNRYRAFLPLRTEAQNIA